MADALGRIDIYLVVNSSGDKLMVDNIDCCCGQSPCEPPTAWAIVDYTNGFQILKQGNCTPNLPRPPEGAGTGGVMVGFPNDPWRTRSYYSSISPIKMGVFFYCPSPGIWLSSETWEVPVNHCCNGRWWDDHQFQAGYTDPCCGENWVSDGFAPPQEEHFADTFVGFVDDEWTNMANWTSPNTTNPWEMKLPDDTVDVTITGSVNTNAECPAQSNKLTVNFAYIGVTINVADDATLYACTIENENQNNKCGQRGILNVQGKVTATYAQNYGTVDAVGDITWQDGTNHYGGLLESDGIVEFKGWGSNYGEVKASGGDPDTGQIFFKDNSYNLCGILRSTVKFMDSSHNDGPCSPAATFDARVLFVGSSINYGEIVTAAYVKFSDGSKNLGSVVGSSSVSNGYICFEDSAENRGTVSVDTGGQYEVCFRGDSFVAVAGNVTCDVTFYDNAKNYGSLTGENVTFKDHSFNYGTSSSTVEFYNTAENRGTLSGTVKFYGQSKNEQDGVCNGETKFYDQSQNAYGGMCWGQTKFYDSAQNYGGFSSADFYGSSSNQMTGNSGVLGQSMETGNFYDNSTNAGNVWYGNFYDNATNPGSVGEVTVSNSGVAVFNGQSNHTGIVYGMATFNDASNNMGTVTGNVFCNTTGIC